MQFHAFFESGSINKMWFENLTEQRSKNIAAIFEIKNVIFAV